MQQIDQQSREEATNSEHLNLLSIFCFVFGGLTLLVSFIMLIYAFVFGFISSRIGEINTGDQQAEEIVNTVFGTFTIIFIVLAVVSIVIGILQIISGLKLRKRTKRNLSQVAAILALPSVPIGTALGVFTLIVLSKPSVIEMYRKTEEKIMEEKYGMNRY